MHNGVDDVLEKLEAILVTAREANTKMRPQHTSLHAVRERVALGGHVILEPSKELGRHV